MPGRIDKQPLLPFKDPRLDDELAARAEGIARAKLREELTHAKEKRERAAARKGRALKKS